ncbi:ribosome assembly factor SBDS [Candidatus Woesearchaeota archaeon]|nr:ribosome assembly factor SBDS [Candidatus Woesearchaeota archaeon]
MSLTHEKVSFNLAKLKKAGNNFEIVIDSDKAMEYKQGKDVDLLDVLKDEKVFSDAQKGLLASEHAMKEIFKTSDSLEVAKIILKDGEVQLTAEYRAKVVEEKRRKIIELIHRNGVDPKTHLPHPVTRIENAFAEAKVHIDQNKSAEDQLQNILKELMVVLPIKFEMKEVAVKIPSEYGAKSYSILKSFGRILRDDWQTDGSLIAVIEIAAGLEQEFYDKLNDLTHGGVESKVLKII